MWFVRPSGYRAGCREFIGGETSRCFEVNVPYICRGALLCREHKRRLHFQNKEYTAIPKSKKILCVDDHSDTCELITTILTAHEVTSAYSMADAVKQATAEAFDLYILDYHLPDGTGLELCLMLRAFDQATPMLFATGSSSITEAQVITAGAQGLVRKCEPTFTSELLARVAELINTKSLATS